MNGFVPTSLDHEAREQLMDDIGAFMGGAKDKAKDLFESTNGLATLKTAAFAGAVDDTAKAQMQAVYAASLYRDAQCAYATRGRIMGQTVQNQLVELHMGAVLSKLYMA